MNFLAVIFDSALFQLLIITAVLTVIVFFLLNYFQKIGTTSKTKDISNRWSKSAKPTLGGIVFLLAFLGWVIGQYFSNAFDDYDYLLVFCAVAAFSLGLWDDINRLSAKYKLAGQICIAFLFAWFRLLPETDFLETLSYGNFQAIITFGFIVFFTVGIMNSVNMLDNMDGVASVAALPVFMLPSLLMIGMGSLSVWLVSGLIAFLIFNWPKSRIFMGDSGSLLLGFLVAWILTESNHVLMSSAFYPFTFFILLLASCSLYLADSLVVVINRLRHGISPAQGGRDHSTHNLVYAGLSEKQVAWLFLGLATIETLFCALLSGCDTRGPWDDNRFVLIASLVVGYFFLLFLILFGISLRNLRKGKYTYIK